MLLLDLYEARDPKKSYHFEEVKGKVDKIIVKLEGTESANYTKMAKRYKEINTELKKLSDERDGMNEKIKKDILENFFDAEDAVLTRVVETVSLTAQLAKTPQPSPKIDNDKVVGALLELMPELKDKIAELQKQFTEMTKPKSPSLTIKTEGVSDVWAAIKAKAKDFLKSIKAWGSSYDAKLAEVRKMMKPARQVAETRTIAYYDEIHRQRVEKGEIMKAKKAVQNLKDSSIPQADVDALVKAMAGIDGDRMIDIEQMKQFAAKAKVDEFDALVSAGFSA